MSASATSQQPHPLPASHSSADRSRSPRRRAADHAESQRTNPILTRLLSLTADLKFALDQGDGVGKAAGVTMVLSEVSCLSSRMLLLSLNEGWDCLCYDLRYLCWVEVREFVVELEMVVCFVGLVGFDAYFEWVVTNLYLQGVPLLR